MQVRAEAKLKKLIPSLLLILMCIQCAGCRTYFFAYPYPWDHSKDKPKASDLAGTYKISQSRLPSSASGFDKEATVTLRADGIAELVSVPEFDAFGQKFVCKLSGAATWEVQDQRGWGWTLEFQSYRPLTKPTAPECELENSVFRGFLVLSRHSPYRLYQYVGDPDSDTGIEFERVNRQ